MNKYSRVRQIGEGAFGKAVLVKRKDSSKQFVVKEINIMKMASKEREQARKEVSVLAQLKHPNIVAYVESFEERGTLYIVMNYCSGGDLFLRISERRGQLFSEDQVLDWFVQLCLAVKHIHDRKILHRDIKCQNIFLTQAGHVQLGDFGIAKVLSSTVQLAHTCIGTPYYLSPEIVENMPYNNKSDIWSIGCVLYELTTLKHAFEAGNMKNLVLKIIRASYPPISPQFSYDLRGLIAQLFKRNPRDRPGVNNILRKNFIMQRVKRMLSAQDLADEFSHTVMHGHNIAKALPPAPKPSADPSVRPPGSGTPRPGSAAKKYDPAAVYGAPLNSSKNRLSGEQKKRPSTPNRQLPIPGQAEWDKRKKERQDAEQRRKADIRKREQEMNERKLKDHLERQKVARMNKAREEGWRSLVSPGQGDEANRTPTPSNNLPYSPRPLPAPKANQKNIKERGNYNAYNEYLDKMYKEKYTPPPDPRQGGNQNHVDVVYMAAHRPQIVAGPQQWSPVPKQPYNVSPLGVPVPAAIDQAGRDRYSYNMQLGAQAAHRARVVEDYIQRQRQAALNKMRAQHDLFGVHRPMSADRRASVPTPRQGSSPKRGGDGGGGDGRGGGLIGRNREEQEYLEKLRQIRIQNMKDRGAINKAKVAEDASRGKNSPDSEERRKKMEALKAQAEQWADLKRNELKHRQGIVQDKPPTPVPAVPITGALHAIGAGEKVQQQLPLKDEEKQPTVPLTNAMQMIAGVVPPKVASSAELERPKTALQMKKDKVLKVLNEKNPSRGKWGVPASPAVPAIEEIGRGKWGSPASPSINVVAGQRPDSAHAQWGDGKDLHLSKVSLETTASGMEATGLGDGVINMSVQPMSRNAKAVPTIGNQPAERGRWIKKSNVVTLLDNMPVNEVTLTADNSTHPGTPPLSVGAGSTIIVSSHKSVVQEKTITINQADEAKATEEVKKPTKTVSPLPPERSGTVILSRKYTGGNVPIVDEPDSSPATETDDRSKAEQKIDLCEIKPKDTRNGAKSVQMNLTNGNFDLKNTELLRTCSEPDLTQLSCSLMVGGDVDRNKMLSVVLSTLRRHHSLDLTPVNEEDVNLDSGDDDDDFSEVDIDLVDNNDDDDVDSDGDNDDDNDTDEEDEDVKSMRESMQSILDDEETDVRQKTITNQQNSLDTDTVDSDKKMSSKKIKANKTEGDQNEETAENGAHSNEESTNDEIQGEKDYLSLTLGLENDDDSDDETIFGDDGDDSDRFGRLEELRKDLVTELGVDKLLEVYQIVQKVQEDEAESTEDDAKLALQLLGSEKHHLFPKIFQLVMSDTAFTVG